ncbi:osmoprotectant transport system permease protein [Marinococcus luteus]|uniref:Osmoprotectant transport system permease protein n=1 Tax=Marinococcus luteus TaxID=1122204 RepID=A0A1H2R571_9BACI|nr:ABC transporter permease/substrate-binding protein [Marinococcus luteus]SDW14348.1 osmoprotectant transport system permease protein [Marinococcus luteus]
MNLLENTYQLFTDEQAQFWTLVWEHVNMSLISLLCASFIAVPVGVLLTRRQSIAEPIIGIAAVLQTIPSLALLGFMILILNQIGTVPAVVALTAYALLPILRNTYTGIAGVDPALVEAATGMGMNSFRRLRKIELPMAMPVIMAGIRTSMVLIVGTATLAALISAGGLGDFIMTGIDRADNAYILLGAIPAALLALFFDLVLRITERTSQGKALAPVAIVLGVALLVVITPALASNQQEELVIGGKEGAEPEILANMYSLLIEENTDLETSVDAGLGSTSIAFNALESDDIDIYPEFTGTVTANLYDQGVPAGSTREEVYEEARSLLADDGLAYLDPMEFNNTYALALREEEADNLGIETISDLEPHTDELVPGFTFEFADRQTDGYPAIVDTYGFEFDEVETLDAGLRSNALQEGQIDLIDAYSTDAYIIEYGLTVLEDDENVFPPYQGAPLLKQETLDDNPGLEEALNRLGGQITDEEMQEMNYEVDYEGADHREVARDYLEENNLLGSN